MKYIYNYNAISFGSVITGTVLENHNAVTDLPIVKLPLGSGDYPCILEGNGAENTRKYTNGLLSSKADPQGNMINFARDQGGFGYVNSRTEANSGAVVSYQRDYAGRIQTRTDALGKTSTHTYNGKGFVLLSTDELNHTTTITRDTVNSRPLRVDYPDGSYETLTYNGNSQPLTHRLRNGGIESFPYDALGNVTTKTDALGKITHYTYYPSGLVSSVTDPRGNTTSYTYNWRGQVLTITHPDNTTISYQYDVFGNRTSVTDELNHTTTYTYNEYNRLKAITDPLGRTTTFEYGEQPGATDSGYVSQVSRVSLPSGKKIESTYDTSRRLTSRTVGAATADAATTHYTYDGVGNVATMTDPRGKTTSFTYNLRHQRLSATDPLNHTTSWSYDDRGNKIKETRPDAGFTTFSYDNLNRLISSTDPKNQATTYAYGGTGLSDFGNNLVKLTDARNNAYIFNYDLNGRKTASIYPDRSHENWTYDDAGNAITFATRAGQIRSSTYDNRNRQTLADWNDSTPDVAFGYDAAGRLLTATSSASTLTYTYDAANELTSETQNIAGAAAPGVVTYTYDADGNRAGLTYPDGHVINYAYTARNQVGTINVDGASPLVSYGYDLNGNVSSKSLENGTNGAYSYDDASRLLTVDHQKGGASFARFDYAYNSVNNPTSRMETDNGAAPSTDVYGYDAIDQVTQVKYNFDAGTNNQDRLVAYEYDAAGNRAMLTDNGAQTAYSTNNLNEYIEAGTQSPSYDGNGNLQTTSGFN